MRNKYLICHEEYQTLLSMLYAYRQAGVYLTLSGKPASPKEVARVCTAREDCCYMGDYIPDEQGKLREIRFDKIKRE